MKLYVDVNKQLWLSYEYLKNTGISENSIKNWTKRNIGSYKYINGRTYINYDTIPTPTRKKLYGKGTLIHDAKQEQNNNMENMFYNHLNQAYSGIAAAKWRNLIHDAYPQLDDESLTNFSKRAAVIEKALNLNPHIHGNLQKIFNSYLRIYPGVYSKKSRFSMMLTNAREKGIIHAAVDKRLLNKREPVHGDLVRFWAAFILNHNKAFTLKMSYETFADTCQNQGIKSPSYDWFLRFYYDNRNTIDQNRYGQMEFEKLNQNYAKIIPALYAGDQWQMDGWRIPVYCKKYSDNGRAVYFVTYNLFAVLDAHSRKIVGYWISETENTQSILKGIEMAVKETLTLPYEIVADNHSFNKTKEAGNIKEEMDKLGVTWTIDSNPRRKSILERAFKTLGEKFYKKQYGYIGQGIRSKEKGGITQQELRDIYTRPDNFLTYHQIVALTVSIVEQYNSTKIKKLSDSPNNLYAKSEQPHSIKVDDYKRLQLFTLKTEYKVSYGQITIQRGSHKYEYQLPAEYAQAYNNQTVTVRYADYDIIYLYDLLTDEPICNVNQKHAIHGAKANQTDRDRELLYKNKGRIRGINTRTRKQKSLWLEKAASIDPNAYETVNSMTTPKVIQEELRTNYEVRRKTIDQGVNPDTVPDWPNVSEMLDPAMKPPKEKENRHPFHVGEGTMKKIKVNMEK